jgi:hypothetical protein
MLKITQLQICVSEHTNDEQGRFLELTVSPSLIDYMLTLGTLVTLLFFSYSFAKSVTWLVVALSALSLSYCYSVLEEHVSLHITRREVTITRSKVLLPPLISIPIKTIQMPTSQCLGVVIAEKDLRVKDQAAYRMEVDFANGLRIPLSNGYIIKPAVLAQFQDARQIVGDVLASYQDRELA